MFNSLDFTQIISYLIYILIPVLALYIGYLVITKAFNDMGFSSLESIIIVFVSFILGAGIVDEYIGFNLSNIYLFSYHNWSVGLNMGGAVIPILLSVYLIIKNKLSLKKICVGILIVTIVAFFVTRPVPNEGIVSSFPYWLLPAIFASFSSIILLWKDFFKAAPFAYICGTIGVLIGADFLHMPGLLNYQLEIAKSAIIGGAVVFDMIFITGILAVVLDGIILYNQRSKYNQSS
ncbi:MAG: DUF1614 domain-containing protein [Thermoplasmatales archaeon]|nr:MAG: DUF1614 domain-containing protein [Thermoplasmatales archaeon]